MSGWLDRRRLPLGGRRPGNKGGGNFNPGSKPKGGFGGGGGRGRGRNGGGGGGGGGANLAPSLDSGTLSGLTDTLTVTADASANALSDHSKIVVNLRNITFTGTVTSVDIQLSTDGGSTWKTTSGDYRDHDMDAATGTAFTDSTAVWIGSDATPTDLAFEIYGMGVAAPTQIWARDITGSGNHKLFGGYSTAAEVDNAFRVVFSGTSVDLTGGTYEIYFGGTNGLTLIQTIDMSTGGPFDVTNLGGYSTLYFVWDTVTATTTEATYIYPSADNGSTFDTTSSIYYNSVRPGAAAASTLSDGGFRGTVTDSGSSASGIDLLTNWNIAVPCSFFSHQESRSISRYQFVGLQQTVATAYNALRIAKPADDFTGGTVYIYGETCTLDIIDTITYPQTGDQVVDVTGYAQINVVQTSTSPSAADYFVRVGTGGTPLSATGSYISNRYRGVTDDVDTTGTVSTSMYVHDGTTSTSQKGSGIFYGWDMAFSTRYISMNFNNTDEMTIQGFKDNTTAYDQLHSIDDTMNGGTLYVVGRTTT